MKEFNKPIIAKIRKTLEKFPNPEDQKNGIEILLRYDDRGIIKHEIIRYWKNISGHWLGSTESVFDFDFYDAYKIVGFVVLDTVLDMAETMTNGELFNTANE